MQTNNKLREALIAMLDERCRQCYINDQICTQGLWCHWNGKRGELCTDEAMDKAIAALAEPVKNCDVGTAKEQEKRFHDFCRARHLPRMEDSSYCAYKCPLEGGTCCELQWAQMPYEEGGSK